MRNQKTRELVLCALFTALTAVGAFIKIPVPVVPFTLQFLFTMLAGLLLGGRLGAISVGAYAVLGLLGLPISPRAVVSGICSSPASGTFWASSWGPMSPGRWRRKPAISGTFWGPIW